MWLYKAGILKTTVNQFGIERRFTGQVTRCEKNRVVGMATNYNEIV
jgi:hypothetical protein